MLHSTHHWWRDVLIILPCTPWLIQRTLADQLQGPIVTLNSSSDYHGQTSFEQQYNVMELDRQSRRNNASFADFGMLAANIFGSGELVNAEEMPAELALRNKEMSADSYAKWKREQEKGMQPIKGSTPQMKFTVSDILCYSMPNGLAHAPEARHFTVECPNEVSRVTVEFLGPEDDVAALQTFSTGVRVKKKSATVHPKEGAVQSVHVLTCVDDSKCTDYVIDVRRSSSKEPTIDRIIFDHYPKEYAAYRRGDEDWHVVLYENEPVVVGIKGTPGFFVDYRKPELESGMTDRFGTFSFTPRGAHDNLVVYVTNADHSITRPITLHVDTVPSINPLLGSIEVMPGRLDPKFRRHQYSYFYRVPEYAKLATIRIRGVNDKDTICVVDGKKSIVGSGMEVISLPAGLQSLDVMIDCHSSNDPTQRVTYTLQVVRQYGGSTQIAELDVIGGGLDREWDMDDTGPYTVDLLGNEDLKWVSFFVRPSNPHAIIVVEAFAVDPKSHLSPYFKMTRGQRKRFVIGVRTPENPVVEEYYIDVVRPGSDLGAVQALGRSLGWISSTIAATRAYTFLHNLKYLHWISMSYRLNGNPETYDSFAESFNAWNLQFALPNVYFVTPQNASLVAPPQRYGLIIKKLEVESQVSVDIDTDAFGHELRQIASELVHDFPVLLEPSGSGWRVVGMTRADLTEMLQIAIKKRIEEKAEMIPEAVRERLFSGGEAALKLSSPRRMLGEIDAKLKSQIIRDLDVEYKRNRMLLDYCGSIALTTMAISLAGLAYLILWMTYLRKSTSNFFEIRKAFPSVLHPARFWTFMFDVALVSYCQACLGLLCYRGPSAVISIFGFTATPSGMIWFAAVMLVLFPLVYLSLAVCVLFNLRNTLVYSKTLQRYHDRVVFESKALQRYLRWLPIVGTLLTIEISGMLPIRRTNLDEGDSKIIFGEEQRPGLKCNEYKPKEASRLQKQHFVENDLSDPDSIPHHEVSGTKISSKSNITRVHAPPGPEKLPSKSSMKPSKSSVYSGSIAPVVHLGAANDDHESSRSHELAEFAHAEIHASARTSASSSSNQSLKGSPHIAQVNSTGIQSIASSHSPLIHGKHSATPVVTSIESTNNTISTSGYHALAGGTNRSTVLYDEKTDCLRVTIDDDMITVDNSDICERYPEALIGYNPLNLVNSYDYRVDLMCEVQVQHVTSLCSTFADFTLHVPREHLMLAGVDRVNNLFGKAQKGNLMYWFIDRVFMLAVVLYMSVWQDSRGVYHTLGFAIACLVFGGMCIPSTITTGVSKWYSTMEQDAKKMRADKIFAEAAEARYAAWPFKDLEVRKRFELMKIRKDDGEFWGLAGIWRVAVSQPWHKLMTLSGWHSRASSTWQVLASGPVFTEVMKFFVLFSIFMSNFNIAVFGDDGGSSLAISIAVVAMFALNWEAIKHLYSMIPNFLYELFIRFRRFCMFSVDMLKDIRTMFARISFYFNQFRRLVQRQTHFVWAFPGYHKLIIREFEESEVSIVSCELGVFSNGYVKNSQKTSRLMNTYHHEENRRFALHKTLVKTGPVGYPREELDRRLPVQIPFRRYFKTILGDVQKDAESPLSRLVATIHIVNHNGHRYPVKHYHSADDDSYLSLYADPRFVPAHGKVRSKLKGHGYVVKFDRVAHSLVIKGPAIKKDHEYVIKASTTRPPTKAGYSSYGSASSASSPHPKDGGMHEVEVQCDRAGLLSVLPPKGATPNLDSEIIVICPNNREEIVIDPLHVKVEWDKYNRELFVRHHKICAHAGMYAVRFHVKVLGRKFEGRAKAKYSGVLVVPLEDELIPNLRQFIQLRDTSVKNSVIDIDPRDTDAHQFSFPSPSMSSGGRVMHILFSPFIRFYRSVLGRSTMEESVDYPIPCTVVQCVNPIERTFRVEPNFEEAVRMLQSRSHELQAARAELDEPTRLSRAAIEVMPMAELIYFWESRGIPAVHGSRWFNPILEPNHPLLRGKGLLLTKAESELRAVLHQRFGHELAVLAKRTEILRMWSKAYNDRHLFELQLARDSADWKATEIEDLASIAQDLRAQKRTYENQITGFVYPMTVGDRLVSRRANMAAQMMQWQREIEAWLLYEEHASMMPYNGGISCLEHTILDIMRSLRSTFFKVENLQHVQYRSILHYVTSSRNVRGPDPVWRPDPLSAHTATVRVWPMLEDGTPDFSRPHWMPCVLKLTGNTVKIMFPHRGDVETTKPQTIHWWNHVTGWYVPLQCFEKFELSVEKNPPVGAKTNAATYGMHGQLVCRKNLHVHVDDGYVRHLGSKTFVDEFDAREFGKFRVVLGQNILPRDAHGYPPQEQSSLGDRYNVFPLTFRFNAGYYPRWEDVIFGARMFEPHRNLEGFDGRIVAYHPPSTMSSSIPLPPVPSAAPTLRTSEVSMTSISESYESTSETEYSSESESVEDTRTESAISVTPPPTPKPPKGIYRGDWHHWRYHGYGTLYDHEGGVVYEGQWKNGRRDGKGLCYFEDHRGLKWKYEGHFNNDEFCGHGKLTLLDEDERRRLRDSKNLEDRWRIVAFEGNFALPHEIPRKHGSFDHRDNPPAVNPQLVKALFGQGNELTKHPEMELHRKQDKHAYHYDSDSSDTVSSSQPDKTKRVVIDLRRTISATGDVSVSGFVLNKIGLQWGTDTADRRPGGDHDDVSESTSSSDASAASIEAKLREVSDVFLPHRTRWARVLDPTLGYQGIESRMHHGIVTFADGCGYKGHLTAGHMHGKGFFWCPDLCPMKLDGHWKHGKPHGYGKMEYGKGKESVSYSGEFSEGKRQGKGTFVCEDGKLFMDGFWHEDILGGGDCVIDIDRSIADKYPFVRYVGNVEDGLPQGFGKLTWKDKVYYKGEFVKGERSGTGTVFDDFGKAILHGSWERDSPNGRIAKYTLPDKRIYAGDIVSGQRQGFGELWHANGSICYDGDWKNDLPSGHGKYFAADGVYDGEWSNGKRQGKGLFKFVEEPVSKVSGVVRPREFDGDWSNDKPHGTGRYLDKDGSNNTYEFQVGKMLDASRKAYRSSPFSRVPPVLVKPDVEDCVVHAFDPIFWGRKRRLQEVTQRPITRSGFGLWERHLDHPFNFVPPENASSMPDGPRQESEKRPLSSNGSSTMAKQELIVIVHAAKGLDLPVLTPKEGSKPFRTDPYVRVMVGPELRRTRPTPAGGEERKWNASLRFPHRRERTAIFSCYVRDPLDVDMFLAQGEFDLAEFIKSNKQGRNAEIQLQNAKKEDAGKLYVTFELQGDGVSRMGSFSSFGSYSPSTPRPPSPRKAPKQDSASKSKSSSSSKT